MKEQTDEEFIEMLKNRILKKSYAFAKIEWSSVEEKLRSNKKALKIIQRMESTGGEPNIIDYDAPTNEYTICDCSIESPAERRSLCYDKEALDSRAKNKPANSMLDIAKEIGIEVLNEQQYRKLQEKGNFDTKTSSWIKTPDEIRNLGGALFCDRRYDQVFTYHNGADSYYASRGFRGIIRV